MRKILSAFIVVILLVCNVPVCCAESEIIIDSCTVDLTGAGEIIGRVTEWEESTQVTFLAMENDGTDSGIITGDTIVFIDQIKIGNNGVFLFKFIVPSKFSKRQVIFRIGSNSGAEAVSVEYDLPKLPPGLESVVNNSVMYGADVYTLDSIYLATEYVTESILYGGNKIYYKLGDEWYDLLNPNATTAAYLIPRNAEGDSVMSTLKLRYYYFQGKKVELKTEGV